MTDTVAAIAGKDAEDRVAVASNWRLVWWRFRRHHLAMASAGLLIFLYLIVLAPNFFSTQDPERTDARQAFIPVQMVHFFDGGTLSPWVPAIVGKRNPTTLRMEWVTDPQKKVPIRFFAPGFSWRVFGLFETNLHLIAPADPAQRIFLLGSDRLGRDQWSRIMHGTQTSMTVGLVAVALSVILGVVPGGISGSVGRPAARLDAHTSLLRHHRDPVAGRLDDAGPRSARPLPRPARGGFRAGGPPCRLLAHAHHPAPHGADLPEPHHRDEFARHPGDEHRRDLALLPGPRHTSAGHRLGRAPAGGAE